MKQDVPELTPRQRSQISALKKLPDDQINTADIPEVLDWSNELEARSIDPGESTWAGRLLRPPTPASEGLRASSARR